MSALDPATSPAMGGTEPRPAPVLGDLARLSQRLAATLAVAVLVAFILSLQFLAQPFVWRNWPADEVLRGWLFILRDRLIVAGLIGLAIAAQQKVRARSPIMRSVLLATAVVLGAVAGEACLSGLDRGEDPAQLLTHTLRWSAIAMAAALTYYLWRASTEAQEQLRRETLRHHTLARQMVSTRLTALRKQIEPHFLFNTLATIRRMHQTDSAQGARLLASFIDYLRRLLPLIDRSEVALGDEVTLVEAYLVLAQARLPGRLAVQVEVPPSLRAALVPPLALATLIENAVKHGIAPCPDGGLIRVQAQALGDMLQLSVVDTGVGLAAAPQAGTGVGLFNIRARLEALYGAHGVLRIETNTPRGVRASMWLPLHAEAA